MPPLPTKIKITCRSKEFKIQGARIEIFACYFTRMKMSSDLPGLIFMWWENTLITGVNNSRRNKSRQKALSRVVIRA